MITPNQYGGLAYLWTIPVAAAGYQAAEITCHMYDAMTGNYILSIANTPSMQITEDERGNLIGYYVNSSQGQRSLTVWNSTRCINLVRRQLRRWCTCCRSMDVETSIQHNNRLPIWAYNGHGP